MPTTSDLSKLRSQSGRRLFLRGLLTVAGLLASVLVAVGAVGAASVPFACLVEEADGGVVLSWAEVPGASVYQYKLDRPGAGSVYQQVSGNSVTISLPAGATAAIGMSPVFEDGSTQPRTPCGEGGPNSGTGSVDLVCEVASADAGVNVSWNEINGAVEYAWKLSVDGRSAKYRRVKDTSAFISLPEGVQGTVSVTPVFADGSIRPRSACGTAAPNDGSGDMALSCTVSSTPTGVLIEWTSVDGATGYQYKLAVEGSGPRYRRTSGASTLVDLPLGTVATVGLAPILADGSTLPRTACGTATAGSSPDPEQPVIDSCTLTDVGNNLARFTWTATNIDEDESIFWRIDYTFVDPADPEGAASDVAGTFNPLARSFDIAFAPGSEVTGVLSIETVNGQTPSALIEMDCGSVTLDEDLVPIEPVLLSCRAFSADEGVTIEWDVENPENAWFFTYEYRWLEPDLQNRPTETGTNPPDRIANDGTTWTVTIGLRPGSFLDRAEIRTESKSGQRSEILCDIEGAISGGVISGPACSDFAPNVVTIQPPPYETDGFEIESTLPDGSVETLRTEAAGRFTPPGPPNTTVAVRVRSVLPDGTLSLATNCGDVTIPEAAEEFSVSRCETAGVALGVGVEWDANIPPNFPDLFFVIDYTATLPDGSVISEEITELRDDRQTFIRDLPTGTAVSAQLSVRPFDGVPAPIEPINCGTKTVGGDGPSPECTVDGLIVTFSEDTDIFDYYNVALSQNGDLPVFVNGSVPDSPYTIDTFDDRVGTYDVYLHGVYSDQPGVSAGSLCGTVTLVSAG